MVQLVNVGLEALQNTPPALNAELSEIVQSVNIGLELEVQSIPPELEFAEFPVIMQFHM